MPWPTPQDYNEAIQNPRISFADPELAGGTVELTPLGLPRPITGNFASVYRVRSPGGDWAVRCFWREYADMQQRYACISSHLRTAGRPYTVAFEYLPQGIRVRGTWYPILKMEWADGLLLDQYVRAHLDDAPALENLAGRWLDMVQALETAGSAHGDLQHGNVLIVGGELKLVDYDGMYVPALKGRGSHEIGHQNYQHPARGAGDFGPTIDRFSATVIYVSLLALRVQPKLWESLNGGDECLLFRRDDFLAPDTSPVFAALESSVDERVRELSGTLRAALAAPPTLTPTLPRRIDPGADVPGRWDPLFERLDPVIRILLPAGRAAPVSAHSPAPPQYPSWLSDHVHVGARTASFRGSLRAARLCTALAFVAVMAMLAMSVTVVPLAVPLVAAVCLVGWLAITGVLLGWYHRDPTVLQMKQILARERSQQREVAHCRKAVRTLHAERENREKMYDRHTSRLQKRLQALHEHRDGELGTMRSIRDAERSKAAEDLAQAKKAEKEELKTALKSAQARHVRAYLHGCAVRSAALDLPVMVKGRLWIAGIRSADDATSERIQQIKVLGDAVVATVVEWRVTKELEARASMPATIQPAVREGIARKWSMARTRLELDDAVAEDRFLSLHQTVRERYERKVAPLLEALEAAKRERAEALEGLDARLDEANRNLRMQLSILDRIREDLAPYRDTTFLKYVLTVATA